MNTKRATKYEVTCKVCGEKFEARSANTQYCSTCREKMLEFKCEQCGKISKKSRAGSRVIYCKECCNDRRHHSRPKVNIIAKRKTKKPDGMTIDEVLKFAREHHMSYGEVVARYGI